MNTIDSTYRTELTRLNDANWARMEVRFGQFEASLDQRLAEFKTEIIKWMFLFWVGQTAVLVAILKL